MKLAAHILLAPLLVLDVIRLSTRQARNRVAHPDANWPVAHRNIFLLE
jgi:hypothetical protein